MADEDLPTIETTPDGTTQATAEPGSQTAAPETPPQPARLSQEDVDRIVSRRLSEDRQRRGGASTQWDEFGRAIDGHEDAAQIRAEVQELLNRHYQVDPAQAAVQTAQQVARTVDLRLAEADLKASDPTYRQHAAEVSAYAEREDFAVRTPGELRLAYNAWKGANSTQLLADAQVAAARQAGANQAAKQAGALAKGGSAKATEPDWRTMSDAEVIRASGEKLPWD